MSFDPQTYVYLDWAATTPLGEEAAAAMHPYMTPGSGNIAWGANANSLHSPGRAAFKELETARRAFARAVGARANEIAFTSGATESDNAALLGIATAAQAKRKLQSPQVITFSIEHDAVLAPAKRLEAQGFRVTLLEPDANGFLSVGALEDALDDETVLVSIQMANSEVGSVQPIARLAEVAHKAGALFHTDATQALGKIPLDVSALQVDAASFSAHKICGPKGVGALYLKARTPFSAYMLGGGQESGLRSGTQNVMGVVGFAAAVQAVVDMQPAEALREIALRDKLYGKLSLIPSVIPTVQVEQGSMDYLPNIVNVCVDGLESETLILRFDSLGFGVSGGSACSSQSLEPSRVLRALGIPRDRALGALRISFGRYTREEDVDAFIEAFSSCLNWR